MGPSMPVMNLGSNALEKSDVEAGSNNSEKRTVEFSISGSGSEFQCHRLDENEAERSRKWSRR